MKLEDLNLEAPHTVKGVLGRIALRIMDPSNGDAFRGSQLCHSVSADYMKRSGKPSDRIILVGRGKVVTHSFVVSRDGRTLADSMSKANPTFDGRTYTVGHNELQVIADIPLQKFM